MTTTIRVQKKDRDWFEKQKKILKLSGIDVVVEKVIKLIKKHKMENELP